MAAPLTQEQKIIHFLNRTSFGPTREEVQKVNRLGIRAYLDEQLSPERIPDSLVEEKLAQLKTMRLSTRELVELYPPPKVARQQTGQQPTMLQQQMQGPPLHYSGAAAGEAFTRRIQPAPALRGDGRLLEQSLQYLCG